MDSPWYFSRADLTSFVNFFFKIWFSKWKKTYQEYNCANLSCIINWCNIWKKPPAVISTPYREQQQNICPELNKLFQEFMAKWNTEGFINVAVLNTQRTYVDEEEKKEFVESTACRCHDRDKKLRRWFWLEKIGCLCCRRWWVHSGMIRPIAIHIVTGAWSAEFHGRR